NPDQNPLMQKNTQSQSAFFNPRVFFGFLLCATGASLGVFSLAPTPLALAQVSPEGACVPVPGLNDRCPAWAHQYPPPGTLQDGCTEEPAHMIAGTEAVYLASTRSCGGQFDILVLAYGFDGELLWVQTHNGAANLRDYVFNLAVSPDGHHLYVVGSENRGTSVDWVTISLNTTTGEKE